MIFDSRSRIVASGLEKNSFENRASDDLRFVLILQAGKQIYGIVCLLNESLHLIWIARFQSRVSYCFPVPVQPVLLTAG